MISALAGKRIVNTRAIHQAKALDDLLVARGAVPVAYPCIAIAPPDDTTPVDAALDELTAGEYEWLVLTSANTVNALTERLETLNMTLAPNTFRTAAIGPATAAAAREQLGLSVDEMPVTYVSDALAASLPIAAGERVFLPESAIAERTLAEGLRARGALVDEITAYQTVCYHDGGDIAPLLAERQIDAFAFTSASTVRCCAERISAEGISLGDAADIPAACIGSKTEQAALEVGFRCIITPGRFILPALVEALDTHFAHRFTIGKPS